MKVAVAAEPGLPDVRRPGAALLARLIRSAARRHGGRGLRGEVNVLFVGSATIRRLHRAFLSDASETDVIAFPGDPAAGDSTFGDISVCVPVALKNAARYQESPQRELVRLVAHGMLHLLGFDDHRPKDRALMWAAQERLVDRFAPARRARPRR